MYSVKKILQSFNLVNLPRTQTEENRSSTEKSRIGFYVLYLNRSWNIIRKETVSHKAGAMVISHWSRIVVVVVGFVALLVRNRDDSSGRGVSGDVRKRSW